jgi:hypothetical protein
VDWYNLIWFPLAILNTLLLVGLLCTISSQLKLDYFSGDCQLILNSLFVFCKSSMEDRATYSFNAFSLTEFWNRVMGYCLVSQVSASW